MPSTLDGLPINNGFDFLPEPGNINQWSHDTIITVPVLDFYLNPATVQWNDKTIWVGDYAFFVALVKQWMKDSKISKEQVLNEMFLMGV